MRAVRDAGSFRDPKGAIYVDGDRILRTVTTYGVADYEFVRDSGLYRRLVEQRLLLPWTELGADVLSCGHLQTPYVLQHPKLAYISYPYEWTFSALKAAALLQLEIYLIALEHDVTLTDASAYNVQFVGTSPVFIDHLAFRRYRPGEYWTAHRQFCEQFLNPLLLRSLVGVPHNAWFRGTLEGIPTPHLNAMIPLSKKLSWNVFTQVVLQTSLQKLSSADKIARSAMTNRRVVSRNAFISILRSMKRWIESLAIPANERSPWSTYAENTSYSDHESGTKAAFIERFIKATQPDVLWDIGCNTGEYSRLALAAGAGQCFGFDYDQLALENAFSRARTDGLAFFPLFLDVANPSPCQGWAQKERKGIAERNCASAILALAILHHIVITKNVPLDDAVDWLVGLAPDGVIEFIPKSDPMVQRLLSLREDIFHDYDEETFAARLAERATIAECEIISKSGRRLFRYENGRSLSTRS